MRKLLNWSLGKTADHNTWYLCVEVFWATVYASAISFNAAYAIRLGATNSEVSLLNSVPALTAALILMPAGRILESSNRRKSMLIGSLLISRVGTLLLATIPWLHLRGLPQGTLAITLILLWTIPTHFFNLGFIPFLSEAVRTEDRADAFAARNIVAGSMLSLFNFLLGIWLIRVVFPTNYQSMYLFGFSLSLLSVYYLSKIKVPDSPRSALPQPLIPLRKASTGQWFAIYSMFSHNPEFRKIVINTFLHGVGIWAATPLYVLYFVRTLGASEAWLGILGSIASLTTILGFAFWRWIIRRWGEPKTLQYAIMGVGLYPLLVGLLPSLTAILFAAGLNGLIVPGVNLSHFNIFLKVISEKKQAEYTAVYLTLLNIGAFICPIIGVILANRFGFATVLIACGLLSIFGSTSFWVWPVRMSEASAEDLMSEVG